MRGSAGKLPSGAHGLAVYRKLRRCYLSARGARVQGSYEGHFPAFRGSPVMTKTLIAVALLAVASVSFGQDARTRGPGRPPAGGGRPGHPAASEAGDPRPLRLPGHGPGRGEAGPGRERVLPLGPRADRDRPDGRDPGCRRRGAEGWGGQGRGPGGCEGSRRRCGRRRRPIGDEGNLDAGEGAAAGAAVGAAKGRRAQKKAGKQAEAQAQQTAQTQDAQKKDTFKKAWGACLEGRGYSVK